MIRLSTSKPVFDAVVSEADGEEPGEAGMMVAAPIEAERELIEIGLKVSAA